MRVETVAPEVEETLGASSSEPRFTRDYILPRKDDAIPVTLKKDVKYPLVMLEIPYEVMIDEDMLGKVLQLKYADHDITDTMKFLELTLHEYLELRIYIVMNHPIHVPKVWARGLERDGILNLFKIPHIGRSHKVNACVKMLLTCVHVS
jgi:hypothetical protein